MNISSVTEFNDYTPRLRSGQIAAIESPISTTVPIQEVWDFPASDEHLVKRGAGIAKPIGTRSLVEYISIISWTSLSSPGLLQTIDKEGDTQRHYISG